MLNMDRVLVHVRRVRCPTCSRVFCCVRHRLEHERNVHVNNVVVSVPMIKRRFRSATQEYHPAAPGLPNGRKRLRAAAFGATVRRLPTQSDTQSFAGLRLLEQQHHHPHQWPKETPIRVILKAHRSGLLSINNLHPVAESSPVEQPRPPPQTPCITASDTMFLPHVVGTPVGSELGSSPSFYETPTQTFFGSPAVPAPSGSTPTADDNVNDDVNADADINTPVNKRSSTVNYTSTKKRGSLGLNSTQKTGYFWSNVARRFRSALRPDKGKSRDGSSSPADTAVKQRYDNIRPRRPIRDAVATPVFARPSLETIRLAHEEAKKASVHPDNTSTSTNDRNDTNANS